MSEPENLVLMLLRDIRSEVGDLRKDVGDVRQDMATKKDVADVRSDVKSLRADVASDMIDLEKRLGDRIAHLNRAVMEYHSSAVGHGVLISEFEDRLRRVEQHLKLPPSEPH
jgi:hypothetical protein